MGSAKIDQKILDQLKSCSKDEASLSKLEELVGEIVERYETTKDQLNLLEHAIKHDYDSILITELDLEKPGPRIVYVNSGFTKMTGYSKEEAIGNTPRMLQGEKTDPHVLERLKTRLIEGQAFFGHTVNYRKDGTEFINQWDIHPLTNDQGEITHWVSYQRDISDRSETSKVVFDANLDFDNLDEESKKTYIDLDIQGNIISSNKSFRELLGYDGDELKQIKMWDLVSDDDKGEAEYLFGDFDADSIEDRPYKWTFIKKNGDEVILEANIRNFVKEDSRIVRIHFDNISMRNRILKALEDKKKKISDIIGKKDEFTVRFARNGDGDVYCKFISDSFTTITGIDVSEVLEGGIDDVLEEKCKEEAMECVEKAFNGEGCSAKCQYKTSDGDYISVIQSFSPVFGADSDEVESVKSVAMIELEVEK
ncbi:PAS domain-containing protein [Balneola sp. MJW-20]|uniref:PAS domain-containing protein n=1 Tax=Gracilimonas aurantiaca TaxID=3234185 RepID=UPI003467A3BB